MKTANLLKSAVLAAGLLILPAGPVGPAGWIGPDTAQASECKWSIKVCSELDLYVWKGTVCVEYCKQ
ncbi:MAG TPA: hypothetical protein VE173_16410 [Longimicrobiales bacterium]|jgi:hypothetical protein|nr:hypothetical protein [Longimicrobiales bacterium]